ncbi:Dihydroorotate dehydrogenase electron transfer subunit [Clostridiaceae bacterium JG1575]|nr:Dihydroorotate dehydrogenase electron transfer subunit [Clostridiaceae bacterium JG1575]
MKKRLEHKMRVKGQERIAKETFRMTLDAAQAPFDFLAGTFLNIALPDGRFLLRRPLSIFSASKERNELSVIYKILGEGTRSLAQVAPGQILSVVGPLGTGFPIQSDAKRVLLIGGGVGVPPLYELGCRLKKEGTQVTSVLGFRDRESVFCEAEFQTLGNTIICTDDGSYGDHGLVTEAIATHGLDFDVLYACGPSPMLRAVDETFQGKKKGYLSFEERMACGIGACYGCMTPTKAGLRRVCTDGPVFSLGEVVYHD